MALVVRAMISTRIMQIILQVQLVLASAALSDHLLGVHIACATLESTSGLVHLPNALAPVHAEVDYCAALRV